jgi:nucleoside-diphosphate-sugar epimerase
MRVLVSGATGYLGSRLASAFAADGFEVTALVRAGSSVERLEPMKGVVRIERSSDPRDARSLAREHEVVLHAATTYRADDVLDLVESNLRLPLALLQGACERPSRCFIDVGTGLPRDLNAYSLSKAQLVDWLQLLAPAAGLAVASIELQHYYGPDAPSRNFVAFLVESILSGAPHIDLTEGHQRRDFIHVDDVVDGIRTVMRRPPSPGEVLRIPLGAGTAISIRELALLIREVTGESTELRFGAMPSRTAEPELCVADLRAMTELGWHPRVSLRSGLEALVERRRSQGART